MENDLYDFLSKFHQQSHIFTLFESNISSLHKFFETFQLYTTQPSDFYLKYTIISNLLLRLFHLCHLQSTHQDEVNELPDQFIHSRYKNSSSRSYERYKKSLLEEDFEDPFLNRQHRNNPYLKDENSSLNKNEDPEFYLEDSHLYDTTYAEMSVNKESTTDKRRIRRRLNK